MKTTALFLSCSAIHERSKKPLKIFRTIPSAGWHQELERFDSQVRHDDIALSGMNLYDMTKSVLFGLAGKLFVSNSNNCLINSIFLVTLLTYELVLMEFDKVEMDPDKRFKCN